MSSSKETSNLKNENAYNSSGNQDFEIVEPSPFQNISINSISFLKPVKLTQSAWLEHIPFAFWLINAHRPQVLVELGTHYGSSYFSFCQAIEHLHLSTRCYAIDMWKGDDHAGFYGENVYSSVQDHNNHLYSQFSTLMRMPFDEGVKYFKDGEVDLLHIDGFHTYDAVKNDFDSWLPKLSNRAVVIIHDSNVRKADFGVYRFVAELRQAYPCFEFSHGHGLTIVGVGAEQRKEMLNLFEADNDERRIRNIQEVFSRLGKACSDEYAVDAFKKTIAENKIELNMTAKELTDLKKNKIENMSESSLLKSDLEKYQVENERLRIENLNVKSDINSVSELISQREHEINQILNSTSWRVTLPIRFAKRAIRYFVRRLKRLFLKDKNNYSLLPISTTEFDRGWYLDTYLDIKDSGIDPYEHYLEHGHAEGRYASEAEYKKALAPDLDENWYHETYSDVKLAGLTALHHYIHYGRAEGRFSSLARLFAQDFDEQWYLKQYPDVAKSDIEPLEHYLLHGYAEGRKPCEMPRMLSAPYFRYGQSEYGARDKPLLIDSDIALNENFKQSIGVHLHLYYLDLSNEFIKYLNNIPAKFDLYISIPKGKYNKIDCENTFRTSLENLNKLVVRETENVGRDIYPFVVEFGQELLAYDIILHIHSKKSPQSKTRGWRRFLLHYTLGSKAITTQILNAFADDPRLGAYFPAYFHATTRQPLWGSNRSIVEEQLNRLGFNMDMTYCPDYPAGSFFWARSEAYKPLFDGNYRLEDFDSEQGQFDGTLAHGFERLFGVLPLLQIIRQK